jgi:L-threonylcarbamoyladenylate synthase
MRNSRQLSAHLCRGGLIAYPTESCYGFGCDPRNRSAVKRLLKLKKRPQCKGLILIAAQYEQLTKYIQPIDYIEQIKLLNTPFQAVTYLMPAQASCPRCLRGEHSTLAVRLTAHPLARQLCRSWRGALVSTSANRSGQRPAKTAAECQRLFGKQVWVIQGQVGKRKQPSTIRAWADGRIVRQ